MYIPLLVAVCSVYTCAAGGVWLTTTLPCYEQSHSLLVTVGTLALVLFGATAVIGTCFFWVSTA